MPNSIVRRITIPSGTYDIADERLVSNEIIENNGTYWNTAESYHPVLTESHEAGVPEPAETKLYTTKIGWGCPQYSIENITGYGIRERWMGYSGTISVISHIYQNHQAVTSGNDHKVEYYLPKHGGTMISSGDCLGTVSGASYGSVTVTTYWPCSYYNGTLYAPINSSGGGGSGTQINWTEYTYN